MPNSKVVVNSTKKPKGFQKGCSKPEGSGRQKGTPNKSSLKVECICEQNKLNVVKEMINLYYSTEDDNLKFNILKELMKYIYPQRKAIEFDVENATGIQIVVADEKHKKMLEDL